MSWPYSLYVVLLFVTAAIGVLTAFFVRSRQMGVGGAAVAWLMSFVALWSVGYALEIAAPSLAAKVWWAKLQYVGITGVPVTYVILASQVTGRDRWITPRNVFLACIVPAVTLLLTMTNEAHHLVWSAVSTYPPEVGIPWLKLGRGEWFWIHATYMYLCLLVGSITMIRMLAGSPQLYRWQAALVLVGALIPWAANALYLSGFWALDPTPFAFTVTGLTMMIGRARFQFLEIVPVARDAVIASMDDGLLVVDLQGRLVDVNPAAERMIGLPASRAIGRPVAQALAGPYRNLLEATNVRAEITLDGGTAQRRYELRISALADRRGHPGGRLIVLHDITDRKRVERELLAARDAAETARKAAEDASRAKSAFLANTSHEFHTPLHAILGFSQLMLLEDDSGRVALTPAQRQNMEAIRRSGEQLLALVDSALAFTYEEPVVTEAAPAGRPEPPGASAADRASQIRALRSDWRAEMRRAATEGDMEWMAALVEQIRSTNPALATELARMIDAFEHSEILRLVRED